MLTMWEATLMVPTTLHTRSCTDTLHHEHQQHKNCDEAHTICDSRNLGFRKDNLAKWKDGSDDVRGKRNKVSWRKAGQMTGQARPGQAGHTHTHTLIGNGWVESQTFSACHHLQHLNHTTGKRQTGFVSHISAQWYWLVAGLEQSCWQCGEFI